MRHPYLLEGSLFLNALWNCGGALNQVGPGEKIHKQENSSQHVSLQKTQY
jgi:hypothetical protein